MCWLDYLEQKLCGRYGFRHFNRIMLENQLYNTTGKKVGFSNDDIVNWIKKYNHPISLFCFDPTFNVRCTYTPPATRCKNNLKTLCYMLNNRHLHPIENKKLFHSLGYAHIKSLFSFEGLKPKYRINHKSNFKNFIKFEEEMSLDDLIYGRIGMNENDCKDVVYFDKKQIKWTDLMSKIINETDYAPSIIRPHNKSFLHPLSNQLYQETEEYDDRKKLALMLKNKYKLLNFEWQNQSITQLSNLLFEYQFGYIPKSNHTDLAINLLDNFATMPITCEGNPNVKEFKKHIDIKKCYASVVIDIIANQKLPIHTIMDNIEPFDMNAEEFQIGLYLVEEINHNSGLRIETQWMSHFEVESYLKKGIINKKQIKMQYLSKYYIDGEVIADYVEYLFDEFDEKTANKLFHRFYGSFNIKKKRDNYAFITNDEMMALSYNREYLGSSDYVAIDFDKNHNPKKWLVERKINERIECDNVGLYTCILGGGRMKLLQLLDDFYDLHPNAILNAVRVDSIYVSCNTPITNFNQFQKPFQKTNSSYFNKLKEYPYREEDHWNPPTKKRLLRVDKIDMDDYDLSFPEMQVFDPNADYSDRNILVQGFAGSNKTGTLIDYYKKWKNNEKKCKVITFTNVAAQNLISRGVDMNDTSTIANFLGWNGKAYTRKTAKNFDLLSIDEFSMIDVEMWQRIYKKIKIAKAYFHGFGDNFQCCPVEGQIKYNLLETQFLKQLLGKNGLLLLKTTQTKAGVEPRCDKYIETIITRMIDDPQHRLPVEIFQPKYEWIWDRHPTAISDTMICKTNKMVDKLNKKLNDSIKVGCKVIINEINDKKLNVYNSERYIVKDIQAHKAYLEEWIADPTIRYRIKNKEKRVVPLHYLKLANACTAYKYQSLTLYEPYIIFEPHLMNLQEFIVSISRARKLSQIRITNKYQLQNKSFENVFKSHRIAQIEIKPRLKTINLYIIHENRSTRAYIGISETPLDIRLAYHQAPESQCVCKDFDWTCSTIHLLGQYLATSIEDNEIERSYIQDYNKFSEFDIVNYRENNYKVDLISQSEENTDENKEEVDLTHKFNIREAKDKNGSFYYIRVKSSYRKSRYGKKKTKEEAYKIMLAIRKQLFDKYYPNIKNPISSDKS